MRSRPRRSWRRFAQAGQAVASTDDESDFGPAEPRIGPAVDEFGSRDVVVNNPVILRDRMLVNRAERERETWTPKASVDAFSRPLERGSPSPKAGIGSDPHTSGHVGSSQRWHEGSGPGPGRWCFVNIKLIQSLRVESCGGKRNSQKKCDTIPLII